MFQDTYYLYSYSQFRIKVVHPLIVFYWYKFSSLAVRERDRGVEKLNPVERYSV